ncbi:sugar transferase [Limosilactobacillus fermentum]|nr:sugar transferase [Limosilactobacillus fermentum]
MLVLAIWIKLDSKGPVLFKQERVGRNGKRFTIYKFRSMSDDAPHQMATSEFDTALSYITRSGRLMRKTSLDELPQLINVVKGNNWSANSKGGKCGAESVFQVQIIMSLLIQMSKYLVHRR